ILTRLALPEQSIKVEQTAHYEITVTNQGNVAGFFNIALVGLPESWLSFSATSLRLAPGESATRVLRVTPPRLATSRASYYPFSLTATSPAYPGKHSQQEALLCVKPFYDFSLDLIPPAQPLPRWSNTYGRMMVVFSSQGNSPLSVRLQGEPADNTQGWHFDFALPGDMTSGRDEILLLPGDCVSIPLTVTPPFFSFAGLINEPRRFTLTMTRVGAEGYTDSRSVEGALQGSVLPMSMLFASAGVGVALLLGMLLWLFPAPSSTPPPPLPSPALAVSNPLPAPAPGVRIMSFTPSVEQVDPESRLAQAGPLVPVMVPTAIPEAAFVALSESIAPATDTSTTSMQSAAASAPLEPAPSVPEPMTYEAMFKEIGERYDLDWRLLASMAYKESSLNPAAVGRDGDMGLMQIMPPTWEQIAPQVGVSDPYDPYSNALAGAAFLRYLIDYSQAQGQTELYWALLAYNWGPTNMQQHVRAGRGWAEVPWLKQKYVWEIMTESASPSASWWSEEMQQPLP
ncbi:MAG: transglycosylase SLT domain-containing protein, partial [Ardenticatenales bacterium]|nr:transglycosylase SLT domain-containing protein [Ardenticatenales bacterium]